MWVEYERLDSDGLGEMVGKGFGVLKALPASVRRMIKKRGCMDDVMQTIYEAVIEFKKSEGGDLSTPERYKRFMQFVNNKVYATMRTVMTQFKRTRYEVPVSVGVMREMPVVQKYRSAHLCRGKEARDVAEKFRILLK